ncbi:MAG: CHAT domain-containing tetratricopeptide repeat protein [Anaerolineales bacterium]|jgi:tetratricopeptide (TPR) repeat protein
MSKPDTIQAYKRLAKQVHSDQIPEEIYREVSRLPSFDQHLLEEIAREAERLSLVSPHRAWALVTVADKAANIQDSAPLVKAQAAWYLGWAANEYVKPTFAEEAIGRARKTFNELNERGWVAACDWQINALPWMRIDFNQARKTLAKALSVLEAVGDFGKASQCRLSLAYAQMLTGDMNGALKNVRLSEEYFFSQDDAIGQARCWLHEASISRRQRKFDDTLEKLSQAKEVFAVNKANIDLAKVDYQVAFCHYLRSDDFQKAILHFNDALSVFEKCDLDLWEAVCWNGLAQVYTDIGNIKEAGRLLHRTKDIFSKYNLVGLRAENLFDLGRFEQMRGRLETSILYFKQAEELIKKAGAESLTVFMKSEIGKVYGDMGRYQDSLYYLERARKLLILTDNEGRLAECDMRIAQIWLKLQNFDLAAKHLNNAEDLCRQNHRDALLAKIDNIRAELLISQNKIDEAIGCLREALEIAERYGTDHERALSQRLLGEALISNGQFNQAIDYLEMADAAFAQIEMNADRAFCLLALAEIYHRLGNYDLAENYWARALKDIDFIVPDIEWRVYGGLGKQSEQIGDLDSALEHYTKSVSALGTIRRNIWQPSLVHGYLSEPTKVLDCAIDLAGNLEKTTTVLEFIEGGKSRTLLSQVNQIKFMEKAEGFEDLSDLRGEIISLQEHLRLKIAAGGQLSVAINQRNLKKKWISMVSAYNQRVEEIERQFYSREVEHNGNELFDLEVFRQQADSLVGNNWLAVDYYLTKDKLTGVWLTSDSCGLWQSVLSNRSRLALKACEKMGQNVEALVDSDLCALGAFLFPPSILNRLTPATILLLAPHNFLHRVPWPSIQVGEDKRYLMEMCNPVNVVSFETLNLLWANATGKKNRLFQNGILLALSQFGGRYSELPFVDREIQALKEFIGAGGIELSGEAATWENLKSVTETHKKGQDASLSRFDFLHIASHIFSDKRTGRLSGIALDDGDVWLDQLRDLAPLPHLVTLSGCNGLQNRIYSGDEHIGLSAYCLLAGAQQVIGSLWPILDSIAVDFMKGFYSVLLSGGTPSDALTQVQRGFLENGVNWRKWGGVCCLGVP